MLVKIVRCDVVYRTVDFGMPSFFFVDFIVLFLRMNCVPTYQKVRFFPARTDLAVKLLKKFKGMLWGQNIKVFTNHTNLTRMRDPLGLTLDRVYQWRLLLEEYGPKIVYIKGIHNTVADAVSRLEYDPSVNRIAESFHTMKVRNKQSRQRQNWITVSKNWCELGIDSDNLDSYTDKYDDWNLLFAHHEEEDEIYPLTLAEIADAQHKDQELKVY
jgi:hypothetical protein